MNPHAARITAHLLHTAYALSSAAAVGMVLTLWCCFTPLLHRYNVCWKSGRPVNWRIVGTCMLLVLTGLGLLAGSNHLLARNLERHGIVGVGWIVEKKTTKKHRTGRYGRRKRRLQIRYRYRAGSQIRTGTRVYPTQRPWRTRAQVGQRYLVLYNAQDPSQSILDLSAPLPADSVRAIH